MLCFNIPPHQTFERKYLWAVLYIAESAGAVEYTVFISAKG